MDTGVKYYYLRDVEQNRPIVTICVLWDKGEFSKGVAVYNEADFKTGNMPLSKKRGKKEALAYARRAFGMKEDSEPITKSDTLEFLTTSLQSSITNIGTFYKSQYMPKLTKYEMGLIHN
jgi:hypothetical protein